jgi:hypothetical protein
MQIQQYNLHIQHIKGTENTVSRNAVGMCERDTKGVSKPKELMMAAINLGIDNSVEKRLK